MPRKRLIQVMTRPSVGDFVLFDDIVWIIRKIDSEGMATMETAMDVGIDEPEEFWVENMSPTGIKTWEVE